MATGLATRCPTCNTVFRVVPDQLRVSEGWVRCGRCAEVFNATASLVEAPAGMPGTPPVDRRSVDRGLAPPVPVPTPEAPPPGAPAVTGWQVVPGEVDLEIDLAAQAAASAAAVTAQPVPGAAAQAAGTMADGLPVADDIAGPAAGADADAGADAAVDVDIDALRPPAPAAEGVDAAAAAAPATAALTGDDLRAGLPGSVSPTPAFLQRAERAQRWRRPRVRAALWGAAALGALALAAQVTYVYRDLVAARYAAMRPALLQACALLDCRVDAPHLIDGLSVESSGLQRVAQSDVYKLSVVLRNRAGIELAVPALDLALTDTRGQLLARRVLRPGELGSGATALAAGRELTLQADVRAATDAVAGYTIEIFYP